jgi:thioredoxin-like negative regulator of GroEL
MILNVLEALNEEKWSVVHLMDTTCAVCDIMGMKLENRFANRGDVRLLHYTVDANPLIRARFSVIHYPTVLLVYGGKVYSRYEQVFSVDQIAQDLERYLLMSS